MTVSNSHNINQRKLIILVTPKKKKKKKSHLEFLWIEPWISLGTKFSYIGAIIL